MMRRISMCASESETAAGAPDLTPPHKPAEGTPILGDDLLHGADEIARFVFGDASHRRRVYYYASNAKIRMPIFRIGNVVCARKSRLLDWVSTQERGQ